jgi:hypothetical protein
LWRSLAALDSYRRSFESTPETLTNTVLLGSLLVPLGFSQATRHPRPASDEEPPAGARLGDLPLARRDVERMKQVLGLQRRLRDADGNLRSKHALTHRSIFREALTWLEIHGSAPDIAGHWKAVLAERGAQALPPEEIKAEPPPFRRRRRRRRRFRPAPP